MCLPLNLLRVDELVIGAPFYAPKGSKDRPDNGIVYIYHQPEGQVWFYCCYINLVCA